MSERLAIRLKQGAGMTGRESGWSPCSSRGTGDFGMSVTAITSIANLTNRTIEVANLENPTDTGGEGTAWTIAPNTVWKCDMWIPWADTDDQFKHGSRPFGGPAHILIRLRARRYPDFF